MPEAARSKKPFQIIPWEQDFLPALLKLAMAEGKLEQALFIFPHSRPTRYLKNIIRAEPGIIKPCLLPEMLPVQQVFQQLRNAVLSPAITISHLDQIGLLLECARAERMDLAAPGILNDATAFFPWGARLAELFEDCFIHGIKPVNFHYLEDDLAPYAAKLLGRLADLHQRYLEALAEHNCTTSGLSAFQIAEKIREKSNDNSFEDILSKTFVQDRRIYIAGFYSPNGCEDILFNRLWGEHAATIVLHADARLAAAEEKHKAHWSCTGLEKWRSGWKSSFNLIGNGLNRGPIQNINYYAGYDLHSQLQALNSVVNTSPVSAEPESKAVILPDTRLLLPVLQHMQDKNLNISMGYPLENTALSRLLENVLVLQENKNQQKFKEIRAGYYWKDCIRLIRHPYIKMLSLIPQDMQSMTNDHADARELWRDYLYKLEKELRQGRRFADLGALMHEVALGLQEHRYRNQLLSFVGRLEEILLKDWENLDTIEAMAKALTRLCTLLTEQGAELWRKFPLDAECLYRFMQSIVPELNFSALCHKNLEAKLLFTILRSLIREERVAFEADPLTATQILGLLESRLLSFKQVFILEATDDLLPGGSQNDPLLPDSLRLELGLPDMFRKQQMTAYYFYRLLAGAEQIHLFWEEGLEQKGLQDAKKLKSRFVEELLWQEEQKIGRLLKPDKHAENSKVEPICAISAISDGPLHLLTSDSGVFTPTDRSVTVTEPIRKLLQLCLLNSGKGLSSGKLNCFLTCPLSFYYQEIVRFQPLDEVTEDGDPLETGKLLHEILAAYYTPKLGRIFTKNEQSHSELVNCIEDILQNSSIQDSFPPDARLWLRERIPFQLRKYLDRQPEQTRVIALEVEANAVISLADGTEFKLTGRLDRIDERINTEATDQEAEANVNCNELLILDYKSGKIYAPQVDFWTDSTLWSNIQAALDMPGENPPELLSDIAERLNSNIQLPLYLFLLRHGQLKKQHENICKNFEQAGKLCNAAWVDLRDEGKERLLLEEMRQEEVTEILDKKIPDLLTFILLSIKNSQSFTARRGDHCGYCPYAALCRTG
ncbi:MAG: PD-(D/E)XK nuclease family protein [Deltaproteobacteria bacterium]|jgi:hypothetical protein|nr:PD-(D/E)XK nuclease family protein [Deltaproteobacteria bacterium]